MEAPMETEVITAHTNGSCPPSASPAISLNASGPAIAPNTTNKIVINTAVHAPMSFIKASALGNLISSVDLLLSGSFDAKTEVRITALVE